MDRAGKCKLRCALALASALALGFCTRVALADPINVALLGTATQSTDYPGYPASNAIDGNTGNFTHTNIPDAAPFWQVDLGAVRSIEQIVLYNRGGGCCPERLRDITVSILDASGTVAAYTSELLNPGNSIPNPATLTLDLLTLAGGPVDGQIVKVARTPDTVGTSDHDKTVISLGEVQVFVDSSTLPTSIQTHPQGARKYVGWCHVFSVGLFNAENSTTITYQWLKDEVEVSGETGPRLILDGLQADDSGTYKVVVTADGNDLTSDPAVLVVVPGLNLALTGTATQSSTDFGGTPERAIDGNPSGLWANASLSHSANQAGAWWQVQLYGVSQVEKVVLWNRTDCCADRLSNFRVSALDDLGIEIVGQDFFTDAQTWPETPTSGFEIVLPAPVECRTVKIQRLGSDRNGANFVSLAECEVFGTGPVPPPPALPNIARACGAVATQSTTNGGFVAGLATNGSLGDFTHTLGTDSDSWWQVDMASTYDIAIVLLHNRTSCCGSRLRDITVSVLDAAGTVQWASPLLNPENELGAFPNGPPQLFVDLRVLAGAPVAGQVVRVHRTADPDFSGGGDGTNTDEANVLSLGEVEIFEPPSWCPADGDTHCGGLTVAGPEGNLPGVYIATASATDDSADEILYTFTAEEAAGATKIVGPQASAKAGFELDAGSWTISVSVDDDALCLDVAADPTCSQAVEVVAFEGENLALGKTATQSTDYNAALYPAGAAVDGNLGNFSHTATTDPAPTWQVDLGGEAFLHAVQVHNRDDCCGSRLRDITVSVLDAAGDVVWESPLLNAENALNPFVDALLGPQSLTVNLALAAGGPVLGSAVRVARTPDPDLSGTGGEGNDGEPASLILAEVQVYGALCPSTGDTHCSGVVVEPTGTELQYLATATATDESGDAVTYTFTATRDGSAPIVVGPQAGNTATFDLTVGTWTVSVAVDDDACGDAAEDSTCSAEVVVAEQGIGPFRRADVNSDGNVDLSDGVSVFNFLFLGGEEPTCLAAADANGQGEVNITSGIYILNFLFLGGPEPIAPYPDCGRSSAAGDVALGCEVPHALCP